MSKTVNGQKRGKKVSIGGPIGAGKSTLLAKLMNLLDGDWIKIDEPLDEFKHYLALTYKDEEHAKRHNLSCQMKIFVTRVKHSRKVGKENPSKNKIQERFLGDDIIFWKTQVALGNVNPLDDETYMTANPVWQELLEIDDMVPDLIVYIRPDDDECWRRIQERHRSEESSMTKEYTLELNRQHDKVYKTDDGKFKLPDGNKIPIVYYESNSNFRDDNEEAARLAGMIQRALNAL